MINKHHTHIQADDREKAKQFVDLYDDAMRDPATAQHVHRVSHFLAAGSLGIDLREYAAGHPMTSQLRTEITAYQLCMLDDSIQEGPHARISRVVTASRAARPPWWSAGVRLDQNLEARETLDKLSQGRFCKLFTNWKFLCQRSTRPDLIRALTPQKIVTEKFLTKVYRLGQENRIDWSGLQILDTGAGKATDKAKLSTMQLLMIDYLKCVCKPLTYYTIDTESAIHALDILPMADGPCCEPVVTVTPQVFQVVSFNVPRKVQVQTDEVIDESKYQVPAIVQRFDTRAFGSWPCSTLYVYPDGEPIVMDLALLANAKRIRDTLCQWQEGGPSTSADLIGCWVIHEPLRISDKTWSSIYMVLVAFMYRLYGVSYVVYVLFYYPRDYLDAGTPVYFIMKKLKDDGWTMGLAPKEHGLHTDKVIGVMKAIMGKKAYLKCLISLGSLLDKGLQTLRSGQRQGYYKALLSSSTPANVQLGMDVKYYKALLNSQPVAEVLDDSSSEESDAEVMQGPSVPAISAQSPFERALQNQLPESSLVSVPLRPSVSKARNNSQGDGEPQLKARQIAGTLDATATDEADSDPDTVEIVHQTAPPLSLKYKLRFDTGCHKGGTAYKRLRIDCPLSCSAHFEVGNTCGKYRNLGSAQTSHFGPREPEAFLIAWAESASTFKTRAAHLKHEPSLNDIRVAFSSLSM